MDADTHICEKEKHEEWRQNKLMMNMITINLENVKDCWKNKMDGT